MIRKALICDVAGLMAEALLSEIEEHGKWMEEKAFKLWEKACSHISRQIFGHPCTKRPMLVSNRPKEWKEECSPLEIDSDCKKAYLKARVLCARRTFLRETRKARREAKARKLNSISVVFDPSDADVLREIRSAEKRAERILKEQWESVERIARSLLNRKSHCLTGKQVMQLLSRNPRSAAG